MEITLESLSAKIDAQELLIGQQNTTIAELSALQKEQAEKIAAQAEKIGKLELQKAELGGVLLEAKKEVVKPTIPEELVEFKKKKYKWAFPTFRLAGDATLHIAAEAALDKEVIEKLLAIKGQNVLVEQA